MTGHSAIRCAAILLASSVTVHAQSKPALAPTPAIVTVAQLQKASSFDGRLIAVTAQVRHADTAQMFTFGEKTGYEMHVVIPHPATDAAHVGDMVSVTGFVRKFGGSEFEKDYSWFRRADYPDLEGGDWVIVATSVRTPEGTELVPPGVISNTPASGKTP